MPTAKFELGKLYMTRGALDALSYPSIIARLGDHMLGNWGIVCDEDKERNDEAIEEGSRLLSAYIDETNGTKFWIITEADRSATTVLLPDEY